MPAKAATVTIYRLKTQHQAEPFTQYKALSPALKEEIFSAVAGLFDAAGGKNLLKKSRDVYLKPNAIDSKPYSYTRPELVEAVIRYWKNAGAGNIYLIENCTQSNFTRMVFALTGYSDICRRYGVKEVFLDEEKNIPLVFMGKAPEAQDETGYANTGFRIPKFIWDLYEQYPDDITIIKGKERCCREGCQNNPLTVIQVLAYDFQGKGGWTIVMGKGHDPAAIDVIKGRVLVAGHCAISEVGDRLVGRLGRRNVYFSGYCNDLCATTNALCHLMKVNPLVMAPLPFFKSVKLLGLAKLHGSQANVPFFFAHKVKVV